VEDLILHLLDGFAEAFHPINFVMLILGCAIGLFIGAMPGLGSVNGVAILLPITFLVPPNAAIIFLAAIYYGAMYGGAISSITLGIPGASTAVATVFDGRPLAAAGKADVALVTAAAASFDLPGFYHGINFLVLAIGIYGIGEILWTLEQTEGDVMVHRVKTSLRVILDNLRQFKDCIGTSVVGSLIGYFVGMLPAAGATPASLMAYGLAKTFSKEPETFGKGNPAGVAAPESANNAASTGAMLPMITLGIPGSPTTAILLGGMIIWGLRPGPLLFQEHPDFVWGLIGSLYVANLVTLVINLACIPLFVRVLTLRFTLLAPIIFVLCIVGGYAPEQTMHDVWLMLIFGVAGYLLRKLNYPVAPAVLAIVLGPLAERSMRQSLLLSQGEFTIFISRPISATCIAIAIALMLYPLVLSWRRRRTAAVQV
jgi:putative tricarboxylic transport membrane protein